ncbi:MAG: phosphotransferase [Anaerolineales bacterium]|nr:phosphotransferase [Anaerolineales bacterium]
MSLVQHAPRFSTDDAGRLAQQYFGISGVSRALPSERDQNFLIRTSAGEARVLKIANGLEAAALIDAQQRALRHLATAGAVSELCPQVVLTTLGEDCAPIAGPDGRQHWLRMLTYVPGTPVAIVRPHTPGLMASIGRAMGELDRALATFDDPALHRDFHWDLAHASVVINQFKGEIADPARRALVERHLARFEHTSASMLAGVRRGIIHGDANDYNLLAGDGDDLASLHQSISGILDFGDMVWSYRVGDLAIAAAYALLDKPDPLATVMQVTGGYHAVYPLEENEIAVLWALICMRLCMSVCHAAHQRRLEPQNEYLSVSERPAWEALHRLDQLNAQLAHYALRDACGLEPCPRNTAVVSWLQSGAVQVAPVVAGIRPSDKVAVVDLSVGSTLLTPQILLDGGVAALSAAIDGAIRAQGANVGIGGNDEVRAIYSGAAFALDESPTGPRRTVHLGIDIFAPAGTPVYAHSTVSCMPPPRIRRITTMVPCSYYGTRQGTANPSSPSLAT